MNTPETERILVLFGDNLSSVKFVIDDTVVDPRIVLRALAAGALRITYASVTEQPYELHPARIKSETYTLERVKAHENT